jgi:RNA polymerase sigma-70 factor (ECF subfamily)
MSDASSFSDLVLRVRSGDADAATELVRRYEPAIRRVVRVRLGGRMAALFDSMDVCQSVLGSFFLRVAAGQYQLQTQEDLLKLLATMARNKLAFQVRRQKAQKRDVGRDVTAGLSTDQLPTTEPTPSRHAEVRDLLGELDRRLTAEERQLVELRNQGHEWEEIAERLSGSAEALRKKHARALDRVAKELGLEGS